MTKKKHIGSTLDSLLDELGEREDVKLLTQKKLLTARIERAMARRNIIQAELARTMRTIRHSHLTIAPAGAAAHELHQGALCVSLGAGERVLGGWPWAASDSVAPKGVVLEPGKPYRLFFKAWAREPLPAQFLVGVGHARLPFSAAAGARVPVTTEPQSFVVDFASERGDPSVGVAFLATGADDDERTRVCLSEMTLTER